MFREWEELLGYMKTELVRPYYEKLVKKKKSLYIKRFFDITAAEACLLFCFRHAW